MESQTNKRHRSRAYPAYDLETSLEMARKLQMRAGYKWAPFQVVAEEIWDYAAKSSRGGRAAAALIQYGLLEDEGSRTERKIRLTPLARRILEHPDANERARALQEAALNPPFFKELWYENDGELPDEKILRWNLRNSDDLNDNAVDKFIMTLTDTISFANLENDLILSGTGGDTITEEGADDPPGDTPPPTPPGAMPTIEYADAKPFDLLVLLLTREQAILRMPDKQTPETFRHMVRALKMNLQLMEAAITDTPPKEDKELWEEGWPDGNADSDG